MTKETFKKAERLVSEIESIEKQIQSREETINAINKRTAPIEIKCEIKCEYKEPNSGKSYHNTSIIISQKIIEKELRQQIFDLKSMLFVKQSNLKNL